MPQQRKQAATKGRRKSERIIRQQLLKTKLSDLGLYMKGMSMDEMREIERDLMLSKAPKSSPDNSTSKNSKMFNPLHNSTINCSSDDNSNSTESGYLSHQLLATSVSSPEVSPIKEILVVAEVHHELNYSPTKISSQNNAAKRRKVVKRKLYSGALNQDENANVRIINSEYEILQLPSDQ